MNKWTVKLVLLYVRKRHRNYHLFTVCISEYPQKNPQQVVIYLSRINPLRSKTLVHMNFSLFTRLEFQILLERKKYRTKIVAFDGRKKTAGRHLNWHVTPYGIDSAHISSCPYRSVSLK